MKPGDTYLCHLSKGGHIEVTLDDRVLPDRTCGQSDIGWWVFDGHDIIGKDGEYDQCRDYFLSDSGILYEQTTQVQDNGSWSTACGICPELVRKCKEFEAQFATDDEIERSFDAYR